MIRVDGGGLHNSSGGGNFFPCFFFQRDQNFSSWSLWPFVLNESTVVGLIVVVIEPPSMARHRDFFLVVFVDHPLV